MELDIDRDNVAIYADVEMSLTEALDLGTAIRYEDYSDFGDTTNAKVSARYVFTEELAIRGAVSTGFRAPGVQQQYFTQRTISLSEGKLQGEVYNKTWQRFGRSFRFSELKEETSISYSLGLTFSRGNWVSTFDIYRIDIDDRIVYSVISHPTMQQKLFLIVIMV